MGVLLLQLIVSFIYQPILCVRLEDQCSGSDKRQYSMNKLHLVKQIAGKTSSQLSSTWGVCELRSCFWFLQPDRRSLFVRAGCWPETSLYHFFLEVVWVGRPPSIVKGPGIESQVEANWPFPPGGCMGRPSTSHCERSWDRGPVEENRKLKKNCMFLF